MRIKSFSSLLMLGILAISVLAMHERALCQQERILHSFGNRADGQNPNAGLIFGSDGNLYGTTVSGGYSGGGTAFQLAPNGGGWTYAMIYDFPYGVVWSIYAGLTLGPSGTLYGAASDGWTSYGGFGPGSVFSLSPTNNGGWTEANIFQFNSSGYGGIFPSTNLISDANGNLYGTASGGIYNGGVVFELVATAQGLAYKALYNFAALGTTHATSPDSPLIFDNAGNLYGTTAYGGTYNSGTVYEVVPQGDGSWSEKVLYSFNDNGAVYQSVSGLTMDSSGNLYGTTSLGGEYGLGTVFELVRGNESSWSEKTLHSFGKGQDGSYPNSGVVFDAAGNLYGTTEGGGAPLWGTVFELRPNEGWRETILHQFGANNDHDGLLPAAGLVLDGDGNIYGTTVDGGAYGDGTVFEITP